MKERRKTTFSITIKPELRKILEQLALKEQKTISALVREAVEIYVRSSQV